MGQPVCHSDARNLKQSRSRSSPKWRRRAIIYKGLKPVYWCPECETALAEAEIEYAEDPCHSIYVKFRVTDDKGLFDPDGRRPE